MARSKLGNFFYIIINDDDYIEILKYKKNTCVDDKSEPEASYVIFNNECDCPAGIVGNLCKHIKMMEGTLVGNTFKLLEAETASDLFLQKLKEKPNTVDRAVLVGSIKCEPKDISVVDVLAHGGLRIDDRQNLRKFIIYYENDGLLFKVLLCNDYGHFRLELAKDRRIRSAMSAR